MRDVLFLLAVLLTAVANSAHSETDVLFATPTLKFEVSIAGCSKTELSIPEATKSAVRVVKIGSNYFWKTREGRQLTHNYPGSGAFHYFTDPRGGGYIKVARSPEGMITFIEDVTLGMQTVTYFGTAKSFTP